MKADGALFIVFLGVLAALPPISIDMALPALSAIGRELHASSQQTGMTLSLFMLGFAFSPIVYGPLSDQYGRRAILRIGLGLYTVGGLVTLFSPSITILICARLIQGAGAGVGMTMAMAMVKDLFDGKQAHSRISIITIVANVAPIVAPSFGAIVLAVAGWRGIYLVTTLVGFGVLVLSLFYLSETSATRQKSTKPNFPRIAADYGAVLRNRVLISYIILNALGFGWMFSYVAGSPLIFINTLKVGPPLYAILFACTGAGIVAGATGSQKLVKRGVSPLTIICAAIAVAFMDNALLLTLSMREHVSLYAFVPLLVIATGAFGFLAPCAAHGALEQIPSLAGSTGGLLTSFQMLGGSIASAAVAALYPHFGPSAMTGSMAIFSLLAMFIALYLRRCTASSGSASSAIQAD